MMNGPSLRRTLTTALLGFTFAFGNVSASAETNPKFYAVEASAQVLTAPPRIQLTWPADANATGYTLYRKAPSAAAWTQIATTPGAATSYTDAAVTLGSTFEYHIRKNTTLGYVGHGYLLAGINAPLVESRGKMLLLVDTTHAAALASELTRLQSDLIGDGWTVIRKDVSPTATPPTVKALIKAEYDADPTNVKSVFLFGHIAVPRSGDIYPDGHTDHRGAWAADTYYADMNGVWTDSTVYTTAAERAVNHNVPGDGKFDQSSLPSDLELQVGRVDLSNMTCFSNKTPSRSELDLLRQYLNKHHNFRHGRLNLPRRGLVCDNFGETGGEAFAATGWRSFAAMFGAANNTQAPYGTFFSTLNQNGYLWSYGTGGGSYYTCNGVGGSDDFALNDIKTTFTMVFGSYFGDFDNESNFMRAPLGSTSHTLAVAWAGRPHWYLHHMALGETIGHSARLSQNNNFGGTYESQNYGTRMVHTALLGDPTLRMHPVMSPYNLHGVVNGSSLALSWNPSADSNIQGYHVYRAASINGPFTRLTTGLVGTTTFTDLSPASNAVYMVRAVKLETSGSGTYYNASQGIFLTNTATITPPPAPAAINAATFVKSDTNTMGNWRGVYGGEGNWIYSVTPTIPSYATLKANTAYQWTWNYDAGTSPAAPTLPDGSRRVAACWYAPSTFTVDVTANDTNAHRLSAYFLDWDVIGRQQRVEIFDAVTGALLTTQTISSFANGVYLTWDIKGKVRMRITALAGPNCVLSALYLDSPTSAPTPPPPGPVTPAMRWVKADHLSMGNWKGIYGQDGAFVVGDSTVNPSYATVTVSGKTDQLWAASTMDARALQKINSNDRVAAGWHTTNSIIVDVNITDGQTHQVALYAVDFENLNRGIAVDVLDGNTGRLLSTKDLYNYNLGKYFVWDVKGHVKFRVRKYGTSPSVTLSGVFFQPASAPL